VRCIRGLFRRNERDTCLGIIVDYSDMLLNIYKEYSQTLRIAYCRSLRCLLHNGIAAGRVNTYSHGLDRRFRDDLVTASIKRKQNFFIQFSHEIRAGHREETRGPAGRTRNLSIGPFRDFPQKSNQMRLATNCLIGISTLRSSQVDVTIGHTRFSPDPKIPRPFVSAVSRRASVGFEHFAEITTNVAREKRDFESSLFPYRQGIDEFVGPRCTERRGNQRPREIVYIARADGPDVTSHRVSGPALRWTMDEVADVSHAS